MIIDKTVKIRGNSSNIKFFKNLNYDIEINKYVDIKVNDLFKSSHVQINVRCDICGEDRYISYFSYYRNINNNENNIYTCPKCSYIKSKKTNLKKYGVEYPIQLMEIKEKRKNNNLYKYGVDETGKLKKNIEKVKNTKRERYNDENYNNKLQMKSTKKERYNDEGYNNQIKIEKTNLEKYGYKNVFQNDDIKIKKKISFLNHYGVDNYSKSDIFKKKKIEFILNKYNIINIIKIKDNILTLKCDCNKDHSYDIEINILRNRIIYKTILCTNCNPLNSYTNSGQEIQLQNFIKDNYNGEIILNNRKIIGSELDIYLPEFKIAFEFNGLYWHNELNKSNNYHLNKTKECEKIGIHLIHIYEDEWLYKQDIVKSRILNLLGKSEKIFARKCEIKEINDNKLVRNFLKTNHLQGFIGSKIKIGLYYQEELVSLMIFGSLRKSMGQKSIEGSFEMLRFCSKLNTNVLGGASRLFKYFVNKYNPNEITSYADRSWSNGNLYEKLGFQLIHKTHPNYYYVIDKLRKYRFNYRKNKLIKEGADPDKTEHEIMLDKKNYRIYDSGHLKFIHKKIKN